MFGNGGISGISSPPMSGSIVNRADIRRLTISATYNLPSAAGFITSGAVELHPILVSTTSLGWSAGRPNRLPDSSGSSHWRHWDRSGGNAWASAGGRGWESSWGGGGEEELLRISYGRPDFRHLAPLLAKRYAALRLLLLLAIRSIHGCGCCGKQRGVVVYWSGAEERCCA